MTKRRGKTLFYTVFSTSLGYFGLAGTQTRLFRTHLPLGNCNRVVQNLIAGLGPASFNAGYMPQLQQRIKAYYQGTYTNGFADVRVDLHKMAPFTANILRACRKIRPGRTIAYAQLAAKAGRPTAVRAVGGALARNPMPLIIPCHRVIRTDGKIGGFTATGGTGLKKKMLNLEAKVTMH